MAFLATTKAKLISILNLHREQAVTNSVLSSLMTETEDFDLANGTTFVAEIESAITAIEKLDTTIANAAGKDGLKSVELFRRVKKENFAPGAATASHRNARTGHVNNIKRLLDPDDQLEPYSLSGRVISTL